MRNFAKIMYPFIFTKIMSIRTLFFKYTDSGSTNINIFWEERGVRENLRGQEVEKCAQIVQKN